jgi:signal transduction histidine kinase
MKYTPRVVPWLRRTIAAEWQGPADLPRSLTIEWRLIACRWVGILAVAPALLLMHLPVERLVGAYLLLFFAAAYNITVRWYLRRQPALFANGYLTTAADSLLTIAMVLVGGGFESPLSNVLFTGTISVAMRYGYGPAMAMTLIFTGSNVLEGFINGQPLDPAFAFRSGFLVITTLLASYLRSLTIKAEVALHDRLVELQRLYADLAVTHQELLSLDEAKTSFLANVSHELRTPLTSIRAFSEILQSYPDNEATQQEFLRIINAESERLTRLVNDVLDVTKIESGEMDWRDELVDAATLLDRCARTFGPVVEQAGLEFKQQVPRNLPPIRGDHDRLQQVVHNLLNNAAKFTSQGSISLRAWSTADELHIVVADTGVGIDERDHNRVFEKFQQVGDALTGKPKGTGLGLTICRDIVAHHGGRLTLDSQPGRGSRFTIVLPIDADQLALAA